MLDNISLRLLTTRYIVGRRKLDYQPLPWVGIGASRRAIGSQDRMLAINGLLDQYNPEINVGLDVGCNVGYFSLSLKERGYKVFGVDNNGKYLRIAEIAGRKISQGSFSGINVTIDENNVDYLPKSDVTICLSIWHHWVKHYGLRSATDILVTLHSNTKHILLFETGENEMPSSYGLPFSDGDPRIWIEDYFMDLFPMSTINWLGSYSAFPPEHSEQDKDVKRNLFAIIKGK